MDRRRLASPPLRGTAVEAVFDTVVAVDEAVPAGLGFAERRLPESLLFAISHGGAVTTIDGRDLRFPAGSVGAAAGGVRFAQRIGPTGMRSHYLLLRGPWAERLDAALARAGRVIVVERAPAAWHRALVAAVVAVVDGASAWDWTLASAVAHLTGALAATAGTPHDSDVVARVRRLVDDEPERPWRISELARRLAMSESALAHRFAASAGEPVAAAVRRRRLAHAARRLASASPAVVAEVFGFANPSHFNRAFRAAYGEPPGAHRRRLLSGLLAPP